MGDGAPPNDLCTDFQVALVLYEGLTQSTIKNISDHSINAGFLVYGGDA